MAPLVIGKYRTFGCCKPAISRMVHAIESIEPARGAYLQKTDPLSGIHFTLETPQLSQGKSPIVIVRQVDLSCQTYGDDYRFALSRVILDLFQWFFDFTHNHTVRDLQIMSLRSSHAPDVANEVPLEIISNRLGLISGSSTYTTNYNPGWLIRMVSPFSNL